MAKASIDYDPNKNQNAGFLKIEPGSKDLADVDKKRLLHLLFWLTYTEDGRNFLKANKVNLKPDSAIRSELKKKFEDDFGVINVALQEALISAHLAASRFVEASSRMPDAGAAMDREKHEKVYQQNMSFVMWALWEDAMGHEFSMNW